VSDLPTVDDLTDEAAIEALEDRLADRPCGNCGRSDWLYEQSDAHYHYLRCDECMTAYVKIKRS